MFRVFSAQLSPQGQAAEYRISPIRRHSDTRYSPLRKTPSTDSKRLNLSGRQSPEEFENSFLARLGEYETVRDKVKQQEKEEYREFLRNSVRAH